MQYDCFIVQRKRNLKAPVAPGAPKALMSSLGSGIEMQVESSRFNMVFFPIAGLARLQPYYLALYCVYAEFH